MQFDLFFFYTFTGALSLAAQHVLSQEEGFGLPGDNEAATLLFCIALSTAAWSCIGVLGSLCTDKKEEEDLDDYLHIPGGGTIRRPNRLIRLNLSSKINQINPRPLRVIAAVIQQTPITAVIIVSLMKMMRPKR